MEKELKSRFLGLVAMLVGLVMIFVGIFKVSVVAGMIVLGLYIVVTGRKYVKSLG